ncbi:MAG: radical SAM family heme chaperone HemW [Fibrobacter sp.]|nr:radical SAM family heme chaperone HemW [Fibrobacter sp.]
MSTNKLSLYIHIPFCAGKCHYCDFYSVRYEPSLADRYLQAVIDEWELRISQSDLRKYQIETVYFGGGTPSILTPSQFSFLTSQLLKNLDLSPDMEFSVECNPESFTESKAKSFLDAGVNRLTFGVQSLSNIELSIAGRKHSSEKALEVLNSPSLYYFKSIGTDIIYGLPGQSAKSLKTTLGNLFLTPYIKHLSAYELTINPGTPFGRHEKRLPLPDEDDLAEMSSIVISECRAHNLERYEISNFAATSHRCSHNEAYWDHKEYIGLGCAAHSYLNQTRWANKHNIGEYISDVSLNVLPQAWSEKIDNETMAREMIFLGLRRADGINEERFKMLTGKEFTSCVDSEKLRLFLSTGRMIYRKPFWLTSEEGMLYADAMARDLFL